MKLFVIGCDSIGERHIRNLTQLHAGKILAYYTNLDRLHLMKEKYNVSIFEDVERALEQNVDTVLVCTPPNLHIPLAVKAVNYNVHFSVANIF